MQKNSLLKKRAKNNMSIKHGSDVVKQGIPSDHSVKHGVPVNGRTVGMNKGITRNMGDYESLRVDVWLTDYIHEDETPQDAFERIESVIDSVLEEAVLSVIDE